jgi:branched-chain amino acid transport system substrate-binding protein
VDSVKGRIVMRACDHQAEQPGFVVKVVKKAGLEHPVPEVIATYKSDQVTPACKQMVYSD